VADLFLNLSIVSQTAADLAADRTARYR